MRPCPYVVEAMKVASTLVELRQYQNVWTIGVSGRFDTSRRGVPLSTCLWPANGRQMVLLGDEDGMIGKWEIDVRKCGEANANVNKFLIAVNITHRSSTL